MSPWWRNDTEFHQALIRTLVHVYEIDEVTVVRSEFEMAITDTVEGLLDARSREFLKLNGDGQAKFIHHLIDDFNRQGYLSVENIAAPEVQFLVLAGPFERLLKLELFEMPSEPSEANERKATLDESLKVASTSWTGRRLVLLDERVLREVRERANDLRERVYDTRFESNADSQDLKSLADGLVAVCDMAEPDLGIIELILAHPKFQYTAALTAAVATIRGALGL